MARRFHNKSKVYCIHRVEWRGIGLEIRHMPSWCSGMDHIEIRSEHKRPIPITATGYKSLFVSVHDMDGVSDPVSHVLAWLDREAANPDWKNIEVGRSQLSLF